MKSGKRFWDNTPNTSFTRKSSASSPSDYSAGEPKSTRSIRILLIALSLFSFFAFVGSKIFSEIHGYGFGRAFLGHLAALTFLVGAILIFVKAPQSPKVARYSMLIAGTLLVLAEVAKLLIFLNAVDIDTFKLLERIFVLLSGIIFVFICCLLNVAIFEMAVQRRALCREKKLLSEAQETQEQSKRRYATLFENASDGIIILDRDNTVLDTNASACKLFGYARQDLIGQSILKLSSSAPSASSPDTTQIRLGNILKTGRGKLQDIRVCAPGGQERRIEVSISAMPEGDTLLLARDKTQKQELEEQINRVQRMESIGRLAGGVAHDFNNVLTPILGYAEMLVSECPNGHPWHSDLVEIVRAAEHAKHLAKQLLAFSRKQALNIQPVSLNQVVKRFENVLRRTIREDIEMTFQLAGDPTMIRADAYQLEQVLMNLCINAQDAMPGGGRILITTVITELDETYAHEHSGIIPGAYVCLTVNDSGTGMDADTQSKVFEPFFTTKKEGNGLGLATVYGIVRQHGGVINLVSEIGRGTAFHAYFPLILNEATTTDQVVEIETQKCGKETLMIVEDNNSVRDMIRSALEKSGYRVICAIHGMEALEVLEKYHRDIALIITDVIMPKMNGRELAREVQQRYPGIRIAYMSGYSMTVISRHGVVEEGGDFIQKPVSIVKLLGKVREILDRPISLSAGSR